MKFSSAENALNWAETEISVREGGKTSCREEYNQGNGFVIPKDYNILDAYQIRKESEKACKAGHPCPYQRYRCLFEVYLPDPLIQYPEPSESERLRQDDCKAEFERLLKIKGYLEK